ncbi:MAG: NAD(P)/FAD-dependent oxidoreductase [Paenirhodobacter sp.]|uniref:NAD(P)/FAD-dependent oxidoreductase n=1 Tax=Paenirhodobacter sp. TaxID=1965326 RepID=UPI003D10ECF7
MTEFHPRGQDHQSVAPGARGAPAADCARAHVVVIGSGVAGLAAAAALRPHVARLTLIDQDSFATGARLRPAQPQAAHAHALLAGGAAALERLFPGFSAQARAAGSIRLRVRSQWRSCLRGRWNAPEDSGLVVLSQSRALVDGLLRGRVAAMPGVETLKARVLDLVQDARGDISGVVLDQDGSRRFLAADLVVDASGRSGQADRWLSALGRVLPPAEVAKPDLRYLSAEFTRAARPEAEVSGWLNPAGAPALCGAVLAPIEDGRWLVTASTRFEADPAPMEDAGFLAFLHRLGDGRIAPLLQGERRLTEFSRYRVARTRLKRFDRIAAELPRGYLPVGDTIATFNPVFGQGMSVAALQAERLGRAIATLHGAADWRAALRDTYLPGALEPALWAWQSSLASDRGYAQFEASASDEVDGLARVFARAFMISTRDAQMREAVDRVLHLLAPPSSLLDHPAMTPAKTGPAAVPSHPHSLAPLAEQEGSAR